MSLNIVVGDTSFWFSLLAWTELTLVRACVETEVTYDLLLDTLMANFFYF